MDVYKVRLYVEYLQYVLLMYTDIYMDALIVHIVLAVRHVQVVRIVHYMRYAQFLVQILIQTVVLLQLVLYRD